MNKTDAEDDASPNNEEDVPDDFFDELGNADFIAELVDNEHGESGEAIENRRDESPTTQRRLAEIDQLTKDIERRKRKLERELADRGISEEDLRSHVRRSKSSSRERRNRRNERRKRSRSRSRTRSRSRSPSWRNRGHTGRRQYDRRGRSRSPTENRDRRHQRKFSPNANRATSTNKNISFLEELAQKFAENGQAFPEKDILLSQQAMGNKSTMGPVVDMQSMMPMNMNVGMSAMPSMQSYPPIGPQPVMSTIDVMTPVVYPTISYPTDVFFNPNPINSIDGMPIPPSNDVSSLY